MVVVKKPKVIICDIEGTTTSAKYWGEVLVPFIKFTTKECLKVKWNKPVLLEIIDALRQSTREANEEGQSLPDIADKNKSKDLIIQTVIDNVIFQMNNKRHSKTLQNLQIYIWLYGYETKKLQGHVFEDVPKAFENWHKSKEIKIYTYSSGVYLTQKLLFSCSLKGNLTPLITDFLDAESFGPKTSSDSYECIAKQINVRVKDILFISDNPKELKAAKSAGAQVLLAYRPYNKQLSKEEKEGFEIINDFSQIKFN